MEKLPDRLVHLGLAQDSTTEESTLAELSKIPDEQILCAVASNPNTSPRTLAELQSDPPIFFEYDDPDGTEFDAIFQCIAANPNTPVDVLVNLADNSPACYELAKNPNTPIDILNKLANWNNFQMWRSLVNNPVLPNNILERLAAVDNFVAIADLRQEIRIHPNVSNDAIAIVDFMEGNYNDVPTHVFENLALDNRLHVLIALARCPQIPSGILDTIVETTAIESYRLVEIYTVVVTNQNASSSFLEKVAPKLVEEFNQGRYPSYYPGAIREALHAVVSHASTTPKAIDSISCIGRHESLWHDLYLEIAKNALTPFSAFERLIQNLPPYVLDIYIALANNPNTPQDCLQIKIRELMGTSHTNSIHAILCLLKSPNISSEFLEELFNHRLQDYFRDIIRKHPNCPPNLLGS
jgi:hypothetical protein